MDCFNVNRRGFQPVCGFHVTNQHTGIGRHYQHLEFNVSLLIVYVEDAIALDAGKTLCKIRDDCATVVAPNPSAYHQPALTQAPIPSDVMEIITSLDELETAERGSEIDYHRGNWRHWIDSDKDCQDTRAEALIQESLDPVYFATDDRCRVAGGEWLGPGSAEVFRDASDVDVDHHVP